jgi:PAS domain S-box-containing protein
VHSHRILVVEDSEPFRQFICSELKKRVEVQVTEASDGLAAIRKTEEQQPDLILLDIGLPNLDGLEVARRVRKLTNPPKILFVSQESSPEVIREGLSLGALGYVHKLHARSDLLPAVDTVLGGKRFVSSTLEFSERMDAHSHGARQDLVAEEAGDGDRISGTTMSTTAQSRAEASGLEIDTLSFSNKLVASLGPFALTCLVIAACYYLDRIVYVLGIPPTHVASFWPATPFLVAVVLLTPRWLWPSLMAAGLIGLAVADFANGIKFGPEIWITLGNAVDLLVATLGVQLLFKGTPHLSSVNALAKYFAAVVVLAPCISAFVGANCASPGGYWLQWRIWCFADALGFLTITPAILGWAREGNSWKRKPLNYLELGTLLTWLLVFGYLAFMGNAWRNSPALLYSLVPPFIWAALRLGVKGVSTSMLALAFLAISGAAHDRGPFTGLGPLSNTLSLQLFLFCSAIPFMVLAVVVEEEKQDNAERKLAEQALRESEARFRNVFQDAGVGMMIVSLDGRFLAVNRTFCEYLGYTEEELLRMTVEEVTQPEDWPLFSAKLREAVTTGASFQRFEKRSRHKSGCTVYMETSASLIRTPNGKSQYFVGEVLDVTRRKMAEQSLADANRKLIDAQEEERARIARDLHDDINQRLALLAIGMEKLREDSPNGAADLERLTELLRQANEISSDIQSISHQLHPSKLEYLGIVAAMRSFCKEMGEKQRVDIHFANENVPARVPREVSICLFRVLQETLRNAVKYSGVRRFEVCLHGRPGGIGLRVSDSGVGFDIEGQDHPRGLGLISMRERLRSVQGTFSIATKPGEGTTIDAFVPMNEGKFSTTASG